MGISLSEIIARYKRLGLTNRDDLLDQFLKVSSEVNSCAAQISYLNRGDLERLEYLVKQNLTDYINEVANLEKKLKTIVSSNTSDYIKHSEKIYHTNLESMTFDEHLIWEKLWPPKDLEFNNFSNYISSLSNWQIGSLLFGAKDSKLIHSLVGAEPLYITERHSQYFELQKSKFNPDAVRKMKFYKIDDLNKLPKKSLGLVVAYNEFTFLPWSIISVLCHTFSNLLVPGGILIFNFNDCETVDGFKMFEDNSMTYSRLEMYEKLLANYDLELVKKYNSTVETFSYAIFRKKGSINLIKKYPSVGFIKEQKTHNDIESHLNRLNTVINLIKK